MIQKSFDCVRMKHEIQERILKEMAGLSSAQRRQRTEERILMDPILGPLWRRKQAPSVTAETEGRTR